MAYTPQQVAAINAARSANVDAGKPATSGAGATTYSQNVDAIRANNGGVYTGNASPTTSGVTTTGQAIPGAKPAPAVFSASTAQKYQNNVIVPALNAATVGMQNQATANGYNDITHFLPGETADAYNARAEALKKSTPGTTQTLPVNPPPTPADAAATKVANTPDVGNKFIYDASGQRHEVPLAQPLTAGYTDKAPTNPTLNGHAPMGQPITASNGQQYQAYSDGTYGILGSDGQFSAAVSATDFNTARDNSPLQVLQNLQNGLASLKVGSVPLTTNQQVQIDALNSQLAQAVTAQKQANDNYTGGATIAMNLYGMGNALSGIGFIKSTVDSGIQKIADLQTKYAGQIAQLEESFDQSNYKQMFEQYTAMITSEKAISDQITSMHDMVLKEKNYQLQVAQMAQHEKEFAFNSKLNLAKYELDRMKANAYVNNLNAKSAQNNFVDKIAASTGGKAGINADGTVNIANTKAIISQIPPALRNEVMSVVSYNTPLDNIKDAKTRETVRQLALLVRPSYDTKQYTDANKYLKDYVSTSPTSLGGTRKALGTMSGHLATLQDAVSKVDTSHSGWVNAFLNNEKVRNVENIFGFGKERNSAIGNLNAAKAYFSEENLKYLKGSAAGETAVQNMQNLFSGNLSSDEAQGAIKSFYSAIIDKGNQLVADQKDALKYIDPEHPIMDPEQAKNFANFGQFIGAKNVDMSPILNQTPEGQIYLLRQNPDGNSAYLQAQSQAKQVLGRDANAAELLEAFPGLSPVNAPVSYDMGAIQGSGDTPPAAEPTDWSTIDTQ